MSQQVTYTDSELQRLHATLYEILGEIDRICVANNIHYFTIGGTAIGLLYDGAILPWDDDVDIGMTRSEYNKFLAVAERELSPKYYISNPSTDSHTPYYFTKVMKHGTTFVEEMCATIEMRHGIFVDIFPFDKIPRNRFIATVQRRMAEWFFCCLIGKEVWIWKHCGRPAIEHPSSRGRIACSMTWLTCHIVPKKLIYKCFTAVQTMFNFTRSDLYNNVMTTTDHITTRQLSSLVRQKFGPITVSAPRELEQFLKQNYPHLHRFNEEEQQAVVGHRPQKLSFDSGY